MSKAVNGLSPSKSAQAKPQLQSGQPGTSEAGSGHAVGGKQKPKGKARKSAAPTKAKKKASTPSKPRRKTKNNVEEESMEVDATPARKSVKSI